MTDCPYARLRFPCAPLTEAEAKLAAAEKALVGADGESWEDAYWSECAYSAELTVRNVQLENEIKRLRAELGAEPEGGGE